MSKPELKICSDGSEKWYLNGALHREDGPAVICPNDAKYWFLNGFLHRKDGPAIIWPDGSKSWWLNGKLHREDGPAVVWEHASKEWWVNDTPLSFDDYKSWFINKISNPSYELTDGDIEFIREYLK